MPKPTKEPKHNDIQSHRLQPEPSMEEEQKQCTKKKNTAVPFKPCHQSSKAKRGELDR